MSNKNTLVARKLKRFMDEVPTENLYQFATTQDLINEWLEEKSHAQWLGMCLKAKFGGGGGNPAKKALTAGLIDEIEYQFTIALVDWYASLFSLIQVTWEEIKREICFLDNAPQTEVELYFEILRQSYDTRFMRCVEGCKQTVSTSEKRAKLTKILLWKYNESIYPGWVGDLNSNESEQIESIVSKPKHGLFSFTLSICKDAAKNDFAVKKALRRMIEDFIPVAELIEKAGRNERVSVPPKKLVSTKWRTGQKYIGKKGGFTKLYKTISNLPSA